ncbi:Pc17g01170 [Penicillium rubens Wisconsin 54-1255]|uniref:Pc17g01170 protein n=1 Tax=Penicillium rubens (strain ATCC 28089 / DSM 1075 / NRRL 1951 / Wisconsin 54-1255) TaxID=500485 RepID=B6HB36_PENRW|nr:Pc17g01170 [Penicillium rubens Wisconsin 54-1255]
MTSRLLPSTSRNEGVTGSIDQTKADIATLRQQYTKLILWEEKCIWFDKKQPQSKIHIPFHRWQALLAIHKHLLQEHEHFFSMSQMPSARAAIRDVPYDYAMFNRMWRYGIYSPLELLHQNLPGSLGPMLHFIYHVSSTLNRFLEFDPALGVILYEQLGDVTRYHMAAQRQHRKHLAGISRYWYRKAADQNPNLGRIQHSLAVLSHFYALQRLFYLTKAFKYGAPELEPVVRLDGNPLLPGVPSHGIAPIWLGEASERITLSETRILLTDFGEAFSPSKERKYESRTPLVIRPPEARFEANDPLSFSSDIWTLACTIWSIIAQRPLFEGFLATEDDMTCEHVDTLGVLPLEWWRRWDARRLKFTEDGKPMNRNPFRSWDDRFKDSVQQPRRESDIPPFDAREREAFFDMLRPMLSFRPENRPTTKQILDSEWMLKWALPEYGNIQDNV